MKRKNILFIAYAIGLTVTSLSFVSCNKELPERPPMDGEWENNTYTNVRANFSVTLPEGVKMTDYINYDNEMEDKTAFHYMWGITSPEGNSTLFYNEVRYTTESYKYGSVIDQLKEKPNVTNVQYEPWYKIYRYKIENDHTYQGITYHDITYVRVYDYLKLSYPLDEEMHNASMEEFARQMDVKFKYSNCMMNFDEELGGLFFILLGGLVALILLMGIHFGILTSIIALLISIAGCACLGWFMTDGVLCTFTYVFIGILVAIPIGIYIPLIANREGI